MLDICVVSGIQCNLFEMESDDVDDNFHEDLGAEADGKETLGMECDDDEGDEQSGEEVDECMETEPGSSDVHTDTDDTDIESEDDNTGSPTQR